MELRVLGRFQAIGENGVRIDIAGVGLRRLACYLATRADSVVPAGTLSEVLELSPGALRVSISRLRRLLGPDTLLSVPPGYELRTDVLDATEFERLVEAASKAGPGGARSFLEGALELWRGEPYGEFAYEDWAVVERRRLTELHAGVVEDLVAIMLDEGEYRSAMAALEELIVEHQLRDRPRALLMHAFSRSGRRTDALRTFQAYRMLLLEEIGIEPSEELTLLDRAIATGTDDGMPLAERDFRYRSSQTIVEPRRSVPTRTFTHNLPESQSPFGMVGRTFELEAIADAVKSVQAGEGGRVVLVTGEPGLGKTTLLTQGASAAFDSGALVLFGHSEENLTAPYQLFAESFGHFAANAPRADVDGTVGENGVELSRLLPVLSESLDTSAAHNISDPDTERYQLFGAVVAMLARLTQRQPVILVFDDLQWSDAGSLQLLGHVTRSSSALRLLVLCAFRDAEVTGDHPLTDVLAALHRQSGVSRLELAGLDPNEVVSFVEAAAGHSVDEGGRGLARALHRETDGNPFFLGELLRHLSETGAIVREGASGRWVGAEDLEVLPLPASVLDVIRARVARLGPSARHVLGMASVIGQEFEFDVLAAAADIEDLELLELLDRAVVAAVVHESTASPGVYSFVHDLIGHTLYADIGPTRRGRYHRRVAETLESAGDGRPGSRAGELAYQWSQATGPPEPAKALQFTHLAATEALAALAPGQACELFERAIDLQDRMDRIDEGLGIDLAIGLGISQRQSGDPRYRDTLLSASWRAAETDDTARLTKAALANHRGWYSAAGAIDADKVNVLETALERLETNSPHRSLVLATLCSELSIGSDLTLRKELAYEALRLTEGIADDATVVRVLNSMHYSLQVPSLLEESLARTAEALERAERVGDPFLSFLSFHSRHLVAYIAGEIDEMDRCIARMDSLAETLTQPMLRWTVAYARATQALIAGNPDRAEAAVSVALELGTDSGQPDTLVTYGLQMMAVSMQRGTLGDLVPLIEQMTAEIQDARDVAKSALALAHAEGNRLDEVRLLLEEFATSGFSLVLDASWIIGMCGFAEAAIVLGDPEYAGPLFDKLLPWAGQWCTTGITAQGPVSHYVAGLAAVLGRATEADTYFAKSAAMCVSANAQFFAARTDYSWGRWLAGSPDPGVLEKAQSLLTRANDAAVAHGYGNVEKRSAVALSGFRR